MLEYQAKIRCSRTEENGSKSQFEPLPSVRSRILEPNHKKIWLKFRIKASLELGKGIECAQARKM